VSAENNTIDVESWEHAHCYRRHTVIVVDKEVTQWCIVGMYRSDSSDQPLPLCQSFLAGY